MNRLNLLEKIRELGGFTCQDLLQHLVVFVVENNGFSLSDIEDKQIISLKDILKKFIHKSKEKYQKHARNYQRLIENEQSWLSVPVSF